NLEVIKEITCPLANAINKQSITEIKDTKIYVENPNMGKNHGTTPHTSSIISIMGLQVSSLDHTSESLNLTSESLNLTITLLISLNNFAFPSLGHSLGLGVANTLIHTPKHHTHIYICIGRPAF